MGVFTNVGQWKLLSVETEGLELLKIGGQAEQRPGQGCQKAEEGRGTDFT